jgi:hypothetical protein
MVYCRRFLMIAVAVATVCLLTSAYGCAGGGSTPTSGSAKSTTTGFSSDAGVSGTSQPLAAAPTTTSPASRYIYVSGTLTYTGGSNPAIDRTINIDGSMVASEKKGDG